MPAQAALQLLFPQACGFANKKSTINLSFRRTNVGSRAPRVRPPRRRRRSARRGARGRSCRSGPSRVDRRGPPAGSRPRRGPCMRREADDLRALALRRASLPGSAGSRPAPGRWSSSGSTAVRRLLDVLVAPAVVPAGRPVSWSGDGVVKESLGAARSAQEEGVGRLHHLEESGRARPAAAGRRRAASPPAPTLLTMASRPSRAGCPGPPPR